MNVDFVLLGEMMGAGLAGAVGHEIAHWLVWKIAGREPELDLWHMVVRPRAGPMETTAEDRVAAAFPYLVGGMALLGGLVKPNILLILFGLFMIQIPSTEDVATVNGETSWRLATQEVPLEK